MAETSARLRSHICDGEDHVAELRTWWTQLHELGVVRSGEKADG